MPLDLFGEKGPVALHIMEEHWVVWFTLVKAHAVRSEGGERLNDDDNDVFHTCGPKFSPSYGQPGIGVRRMDSQKAEEWLIKHGFGSCVDAVGSKSGEQLLALHRQELVSLSAVHGSKIYDMLHVMKDGCDTQLEVNSGLWWVVKEKLAGIWHCA